MTAMHEFVVPKSIPMTFAIKIAPENPGPVTILAMPVPQDGAIDAIACGQGVYINYWGLFMLLWGLEKVPNWRRGHLPWHTSVAQRLLVDANSFAPEPEAERVAQAFHQPTRAGVHPGGQDKGRPPRM
jgi:hypothetical protein